MSWNLRALISAMLLTPAAALALGLGEIRLNSSLNEPLSAEIDLVAATPEELAALKAELATNEVFERYGLDRPTFLNSIEFRVGRGQDGRSVLLVRSRDAISEPFVSFLVDVSWARGRLLREYTVLLDPPVLAAPSVRQAAEPVFAPTTMPAPAPSRPESAPAPVAAPAAAYAAPPARAPSVAPADSGGTTHRVERGDTLYGIAGSMTGGDRQATQRLMLGLFRANPEAFGDNINHLRAGAILRVPDASEYADIAPADAAREVRRQTAAWRDARGADSGQLRLVTPEEGVADTGTGEPESSGRVESQIESLERDIAEQRRLLELRNQELAQLQRNLAERRTAEAAAAEQAAADQAAADQAAVPPPVDEAPVAPEDDVQPTEPAPAPAAERAPAEAPSVAAEKSFFDSLTENWMFLLGAAGLLLIGILGFGYFRRRRDEDVSVALQGFELPESAPVPTETMRLRSLATAADRTTELERPISFEDQDRDFVVEERPIARLKPEAPRAVGAGHEETISAEAALDLDQADPLAEADFHMAYGLYDQAVDLVRRALQHSPDRNDLKLKLAEIHFVAGDTAQFLNVARDLKKTLGPGGDWDRMVIMGSQLAPTEPMFAGGVQDAGVDLSLEGGDNLVDLDLLSTPDGEEGLDLDLGTATVTGLSDSDEATGENTSIEFNLDEGQASPTTTQEIVRKPTPGTVELPTLEIPSSETPTVETPTLKRKKLGAEQPAISTDSTAEMAIDDLGLDHGHLGELTDAEDATAFSTELGDDTTMIGRHDEATRQVRRAEDDDGTALMPVGDTSETAMLPKFEMDGIDLDVGDATDDTDAAPTTRDSMVTEIPRLSELEPVTMSEVGTKLDLARAYMDMGDPDGARNILQEVLAEGSASQKQEARRLIDSLPGA